MVRKVNGKPVARPAGWRLIALAACVAAIPARAETENLPTIEHWRFAHPVRTLHVATAVDIEHLFTAHRYMLSDVRGGSPVPRVYLRRLVDDLNRVQPVAVKEALFIRIALPLVVRANAEIATQRALLTKITEEESRGRNIGSDRRAWLGKLARHYGGDPQKLNELLLRVDTVPAALALAQAIDESGWGTSRLAKESNGLFGEHAPAGSGRNAIRSGAADVSVAAFASLLDGVLGYMTNVNRNRAYAPLRALRAQHRRAGRHPDGYSLAHGLRDYSVRGEAYVRDLQRLIRAHKLDDYDAARLATDNGTTLVKVSR